MEPSILGGIVTKELQANLDRFRDLVERGLVEREDDAQP